MNRQEEALLLDDMLMDLTEQEDDMEATLVGRLRVLREELEHLRSGEPAAGAPAGEPGAARFTRAGEGGGKIIVCTLRRPVRMRRSALGDGWEYDVDAGRSLREGICSLGDDVHWVSWPGCVVDEASQGGVRRKLQSEHACSPVFLSEDLELQFYHAFCNNTLWPIFHSLMERSDDALLQSFAEPYQAFCAANQLFADVISEVYEEGDLLLVEDWRLMALPQLLRKRFPECVCGFFFRCPFPSTEFFRMLPLRRQLLAGVLGADLIAFQHFDFVSHFLSACTRVLGLESSPSRIEYLGRAVALGIIPTGIMPGRYAMTAGVRAHAERLRAAHEGQKVVVGVARLDFCKGIPQKLLAFEALLDAFSEWRGRVVLLLVVRDSGRLRSPQYRRLGQQVNQLIGRINGRFGSSDYCPIHFVKTSIAFDELVALYAVADVCMVTSVKEGMNHSALEFVAAQEPGAEGVLLYSEFAGCASSFKGAIVINPYDTDRVAQHLHMALRMRRTARQIRHHHLARYVGTYTAALWAERVAAAVLTARERQLVLGDLPEPLDFASLRSSYERSRSRLLLFDYDGTLVPSQALAQLAQPSPETVRTLRALTEDPANVVFVLSGRSRDDLDALLGAAVPRLGLIAEHGYWLRPPRAPVQLVVPLQSESVLSWAAPAEVVEEEEAEQRPWQQFAGVVDLEWREEVRALLEDVADRTPGSFVEANDTCFTWHYRDTDLSYGTSQAKSIQEHFSQMLLHRPVTVVRCPTKRYMVVTPARLNKGRAVASLLASFPNEFDLVVCAGDERTDEDMFDVLQDDNRCYTITVGRKASRAQYYVDEVEEMVWALEGLLSIESPPRP